MFFLSTSAPLLRAALAVALLSSFAVISAACADGTTSPPKIDSTFPVSPPVYPPAAQWTGEEGTTIVRLLISSSGKAHRFNIDKSSGFKDLDYAAVEAAMAWHYLPAMRDGDTTSDWIIVEVKFQLPQIVQVPAPTSVDRNGPRLVCRSDVGITGTRIAKPMVCRSQDEWDRMQREAEQDKQDSDQRSLHGNVQH